VNRDPIEEMGGMNLYQFVGNSPVNDIDLLGLAHFWETENENDPDPYEANLSSQINQQRTQQIQGMIDQQADVERQLLSNTAIDAPALFLEPQVALYYLLAVNQTPDQNTTTSSSALLWDPDSGLYYSLALAQIPDYTHCPQRNNPGNQPMIGMAKQDINQINRIAKQFDMTPDERRDFGDYIEDLKRNSGREPADNFSWKELRSFAEEFMLEE
jgi:hypothetical protein